MKGWTEKTIKQIAELKYGKSLPSRDRKDGDIPVYGSGGVGGYHNEALINSGIIVGRKGTVGSVRYSKEPFFPIDTVFYVDLVNQGNDIKFLYYYLQTIGLEQFDSDAAVPGLNRNLVHRLKGFVPEDVNVQKKIASILSAYDDLIEINKERIKILEETARELYKEWFVRMRFPGYKKAKFNKGIPEGIGTVKYFKDFIKLNRGFDLPSEKIIEGKYPVIASTSIKAYHNQYKVKAPVITTGRSGSIGTVLYVNKDSWPLNTSLYVKDYKGNRPIFIYFLLNQMDLESFNSGAGVPTLNQNHLHKLKLWVPDTELQKRFEELILPMFGQIENLEAQNNELAAIRDRLLPRLISGKLQVKV